MNYTNFSRKDLKFLKREMSTVSGKVLDIGGRDFIDRLGFKPGDEYYSYDLTYSKNVSVIGDAHKLPFKNDSFDYIICNAVLEHVREPSIILSEIYRCVKSNGFVFISVPFLQHIHSDPYDFRRFTNYGLKYELEKTGFNTINIYGSYGIYDVIEYLLFSGVVWNIKDKHYKSIFDIIHIFIMSVFFFHV
ncbi:class I SAM-dependent methyltransferase [Methanohalophilus portucalensis]|uniref:Class I SAM-dependent methyltransferase n=2 Tax=Methanohalophilus portucalensis TaxID=39664 RepID=A0A1X7P2R6_9EURY|nr:class I SAM-dependent methyltransferase [Methanohalophilus portucalensis]ATU08089.1 hypothetical protein BKM01_04440 [Methanohalophilus portucalensis]RNI10065.1 class I SAM-dependent methyltransferase [Methanohalophilus portucalensis FDF-1]SMH44439.1 Methyltransferase domain-containing protein [Methanohalophilus portucalensis FDF-1]